MKLRFALLVLVLTAIASGCQPRTTPSPITPAPAEYAQEITIEEWNASVEHVGIDELRLETFDVLLANHSTRPIEIGVIKLSSGESAIDRMLSELLHPGDKKKFSLICAAPLEKEPGVRELKCKIIVGEDIGQIMCPVIAEKEISISIPTAKVGYTQRVGILKEKTITLTLVSWREVDKALAGPYPGEVYYVCTARPGNKFVMLVFTLRNDWSQPQKTPYISFGQMLSDKGMIYSAWEMPSDPALLSE